MMKGKSSTLTSFFGRSLWQENVVLKREVIDLEQEVADLRDRIAQCNLEKCPWYTSVERKSTERETRIFLSPPECDEGPHWFRIVLRDDGSANVGPNPDRAN